MRVKVSENYVACREELRWDRETDKESLFGTLMYVWVQGSRSMYILVLCSEQRRSMYVWMLH